jgi:hypothetical protein
MTAMEITRPPGSGMKRAGAVMFWLAILFGVVSIAIIVVSAIAFSSTVDDLANETEPMPDGLATVDLDAGESIAIYETSAAAGSVASCEFTSPNGEVSEVESSVNTTVELNGKSFESVGVVTAQASGPYSIACVGSGETVIGPKLEFSDVGGIFGVVGGVFGVIFAGLVGIAGIILWFVGRSKINQATKAPFPPYGAPLGGQAYGQPPSQPYGQAPPPPPSTETRPTHPPADG